MADNGRSFSYKQGVGLLNEKPFKVLSVGDFRVAEKIVGNPNWWQLTFNPNSFKEFTGFDPGKAAWLNSENQYFAIFDFDTDLQLDVYEVMAKLQKNITSNPDNDLLRKKIMAGSIWKAAARTREMRVKKSWWQENPHIVAFAFACLTLILIGYFTTHITTQVHLNVIGTGNYTLVSSDNTGIALNTTIAHNVANAIGSAINAGSKATVVP